ncbi:MAG: zinc-dependent metalloprotease [Armatimonadaceae bacterium]
MTKTLIAALLCGTLATGAVAQEAPKANPLAAKPAEAAAKKAEDKKDEKKPEKPKTIDELVKDFEKIEGVFTFYRKVENGKDTLYMEVPETALNKMYLLQATASTGLASTRFGYFQGEPLGDIAIELRRAGEDKIVIVEPVLSHRADNAEMKRTIERGIPVTILHTADIKAQQEERKSFLIDANEFFKTDIPEFSAGLGTGPGSLTLDGRFTYIDSLKVFPENAVIRTMYKLNRVGPANLGGPRAVPFAVSYNLSAIKESSYKPRVADPRVGYFLTTYKNISDNANYDQNVSLIQRWNLEKADPNAPLSPPKKPLVWYMSNDIPLKYRDAVKRGLLMYNKAFEKVGIKDAIEVRQMPDDADWDIADVRYNIIRWTEGNPFAIALFRAHPVTGEILNAAINMDGVFATGGALDFDITIDPASYFPQPHLNEANHEGHEHSPTGERKPGTGAKRSHDTRYCTLQKESLHNFRFGMTAVEMLAPVGSFDKEKYIEQYVTEVVAHEMGHCLGLRHNFIASTQFDANQLKDPKIVAAGGIGGTVMEYSPFNIFALKQKGVDYYAQTVGTYDIWAIQYGYMPIDAPTPEAELAILRKHASKTNMPGHAYRSDGLANSYDPRVSTFDLGKNPLDYVSRVMDVSNYLLKTLDSRLPKAGQSYFEFTRSFNNLLSSYFGATRYATQHLGGIEFSDNFKGDPGEVMPITPVDGKRQKQALDLLNRYIFSAGAFNYPKAHYAKLAPNPNAGYEASAFNRRYPVFDSISNFQQQAVRQVFSSDTLTRMVNNEFRSPANTDLLTIPTLFRSVGGEVWSELATGQEITALRRNLQRAHVDQLISIVKAPTGFYPRDAVTLAWDQLRTIKARCDAALPKAKGEYGKPHLSETAMRIERVLDAETVLE